MKYICLGYLDRARAAAMSEQEQLELMDACFAYDEELRENGHFAGGNALQPVEQAMTVRSTNGKVTVTDGPFAETKEQLGGILVLEATDMNHAVQLMSKHPGTRFGPFEIRPAADLEALVADSRVRRDAMNTAG
jgi:hypothetical protein